MNETVTEGNCPWWLMDRASLVRSIRVNAPKGTALLIAAVVDVLGVVPVGDELLLCESAPKGGPRTPEEGVYGSVVVVAFDPAEAEPEDENELAAAGPEVPEDALA